MKKIILIFYFIIVVSLLYCNTLKNIMDSTIRLNKWNDAKKELELYLNENPSDSYAYSVYAAVLNELKLYDDAIIAIRHAINYEKSNKTKANLYSDLGLYYYNKGLKDVSLESYLKSLDYNNKLDSSYYMIGAIFFEKEDYENTILNWKKYIEVTDNIEKKIKIEKIINKLVEKKLKEEEERKLKEEFLKKLKDELLKEESESKSLETDKNKTTSSDEDFEEID